MDAVSDGPTHGVGTAFAGRRSAGMDRAALPPLRWPLLLGFALGGFFDGILLHQILQWHHLLSLVPGVASLEAQVLWDGLFHLLMYVLAVAGLWG